MRLENRGFGSAFLAVGKTLPCLVLAPRTDTFEIGRGRPYQKLSVIRRRNLTNQSQNASLRFALY